MNGCRFSKLLMIELLGFYFAPSFSFENAAGMPSTFTYGLESIPAGPLIWITDQENFFLKVTSKRLTIIANRFALIMKYNVQTIWLLCCTCHRRSSRCFLFEEQCAASPLAAISRIRIFDNYSWKGKCIDLRHLRNHSYLQTIGSYVDVRINTVESSQHVLFKVGYKFF